jgi:hypothetical protein
MAERYMRYPVTVAAATETTIFTAPNDGEGTPGAADSVIIGFLVASTSSLAGTLTVTLTGYYDGVAIKLLDTIPLPASTSIDIMPGKMVVQHALNNAGTPVLTGDIIKVTSTQTCDVTLSTVERI